MNNEKKAFKAGLWYTVSNFFSSAVGFITIPIFTRLLSKEDFGLYNNYTSWLNIVAVIMTLKFNASLISARYDYKKYFDEYIFSLIVLNFIVVCCWSGVINYFSSFFFEITHIEMTYMNAMMIYLMFFPVVEMFQSRESFLYKYKVSALLSAGMAVASGILSIVLVLSLDNKLSGIIFGMTIPAAVVGIFISIFLGIKGKSIRVSYWTYAIPICLPYIPHLLASSLLNSMDRVMIERFCGSEATAVYSLAYNCGWIATLLVSALNMAFVPWLGEMLNEKKYFIIRSFSKKYIIVFLLLAIVLMLIAPEILYILGGTPYMDAMYVITPVAMGCVCQFLYTLYVNVEQFNKKTLGMAIATVLAAIINYGLNLMLIPIFGYVVAAYTTLVGYFSLLLMHMYLVKLLSVNDIYDNRFVLKIVAIGTVIMLIITLLYDFRIMRYIVTLIYVFVLVSLGYKERDTLRMMLKK